MYPDGRASRIESVSVVGSGEDEDGFEVEEEGESILTRRRVLACFVGTALLVPEIDLGFTVGPEGPAISSDFDVAIRVVSPLTGWTPF
jgi:hypothetical protein